MAGLSGDSNEVEIPSILSNSPDSEFARHQEFILRHVDFLVDVLTAEQYESGFQHPRGCPTATPETQSRKRRTGESFPCRYDALPTVESETECVCGDLLAGSDDPLDTIAAVAIAQPNRPPAQRYFDKEYRRIIATLRENVGSWRTIASLDWNQLEEELNRITNRPGISDERVTRLYELLGAVSDCEKTDGVTLRGLGGIPYSSFADLLSGFPGVSRSDAWWVMLVAYDKPVWPADPYVDGMLCTLGLIGPDRFQDDSERRELLEEELSERQIPQLHRAIAGHAVKSGIDVCSNTCESRDFFLSHRLRMQAAEELEKPVLVDLFSGAGGLSLGFDRQDWTIELALDNDQDATDTYRLNHPEIPHEKVVCGDIREEIDQGLVEKIERTPDVVVGGPPCQSLSQAGYRARLADDDEYNILDDDRTGLYEEYVEIVEELRPRALVMENVEGMVSEIDDTGIKVGDLVIDALESIGASDHGYVCDYQLIDCAEYGIPQHRERVIILGVREDLVDQSGEIIIDDLFEAVASAAPSEQFNLKQALSGLPKLSRGEGGNAVPDRVRGSRSRYVDRNGLDADIGLCFNHQAREHPMEKDRILFDEALEPGDTGWDVKYAKNGEHAEFIEYDVGTEENPRFKDKYRMLEWDEPAPTVVAHLAKDSNNFVLPDYYEHASGVTGRPDNERNRGITPREAARVQSFPDDYLFLGTFTSWFRQIGNAVPPLLGEQIAFTLEKYLQSSVSSPTSQPSLERASTDD
jgi:DNA (cytosine-5)-methyltransferase 1